MSTKQDRIAHLLARYNNKTCTREEFEELFKWLKDASDDTEVLRYMEGMPEPPVFGTEAHTVDWDAMYAKISRQSAGGKTKAFPWGMTVIAASIILAVGIGWLFVQPDSKFNGHKVATSNDILPGDDRAILRLSDGSEVVLQEQRDGVVAIQAGASVKKSGDGTLFYEQTEAKAGDEVSYNTMRTPRKGQYRIVLPDGTSVWLNSESAITYPTAFTGDTREVVLKGEAYFEVTHDAERPFLVSGEGYGVKVLGTHFNIMSYPNEPAIKITLLEGSILVRGNAEEKTLVPGEQASIQHAGKGMQLRPVDLDPVVAWQQHIFFFDNTPIDEALRTLERWYDVRIEYETANRDLTFTGMISKQNPISNILRYFEKAGNVRFTVDRHTVVVKQPE